jgi:1-acyl-sn-glycerol-3-phosphate acyltransferase
MIDTLRSLWIWGSAVLLILVWFPILGITRFFDRDPVHYRTGRMFRRLGLYITRANPLWSVDISGDPHIDTRNPYVIVSNHQSFADIPLIANLPWEMKWLTKIELFKLPIVGWMLRMAGDIPVDRKNKRAAASAFIKAARYLANKCSVIFFPEGTRSPDGMVHRFTDGAFHLAIKSQVPILPLAVEGSHDCLPKKSWKFGKPQHILLKVLAPVETVGLTAKDVPALRDRIRSAIVRQIAEWRNVDVAKVDALAESADPEHAVT